MIRWIRSIIAWIKKLFAKKMRRKISLYIADQLVDLDDQSFILFNYTREDLSNPTIVRNSFSQQITLKGTPANNKIFGGSFRTDRVVGISGSDYNASQKTPFTIYDEMGEILESGYVKLDSVSKTGGDIQYKVTLYGGLGSFFYALSYDENGNKRTLADLVYRDTDNPDTELNFTINATAIHNAWGRLKGGSSYPEMFDIINFAPCYNGIPDGNFSPDKALFVPSEVGLPNTISNGGKTYTLRSGYALVNLAEPQDEWAVKDLRSYLQRPILSMRAFWDAICNPVNNGGYEVDADVVKSSRDFGNYSRLWMTLPMIPSIGSIKQQSGDLSLSMSSTPSSGNVIGVYDVLGFGSVPAGTSVTANINFKVRFNAPQGAEQYETLQRSVGETSPGGIAYGKFSVAFIQAVAYGSDDSVVGGSRIKVVGSGGRGGAAAIARGCGFTPVWDEEYEMLEENEFIQVTEGVFEYENEVGISVTAQDVAYYKIHMSVYTGTYGRQSGQNTRYEYAGDGLTSTQEMYTIYAIAYTPTSTYIVQGTDADSVTYTTPDTLRSGAVITKSMLLSSSHTPAEYMISFCKIFGLYFSYDNAAR